MYRILDISTRESLLIIGINGALSIVWCGIGLYLLDRFGRVKPIMVAALGMAPTLLVNEVQEQYINDDNPDQLRSLIPCTLSFRTFIARSASLLDFIPQRSSQWRSARSEMPSRHSRKLKVAAAMLLTYRSFENQYTHYGVFDYMNWTMDPTFAQFSPKD